MIKSKKSMTRDERKEYKKAQRATLTNYYRVVTNNSDTSKRNKYTKLVSFMKAYDMVNGKLEFINNMPTRVKKLKHEWSIIV